MKNIKMSVLGIGPFYVLSCLIVTVLSIYLSEKGSLNSGKISDFRLILICLGVLPIVVLALYDYSFKIYRRKVLKSFFC